MDILFSLFYFLPKSYINVSISSYSLYYIITFKPDIYVLIDYVVNDDHGISIFKISISAFKIVNGINDSFSNLFNVCNFS